MYILVFIMFLGTGEYKIGSNQIIYNDLGSCLIDQKILTKVLNDTKPTKDAFSVTSCVQMSKKGVSI